MRSVLPGIVVASEVEGVKYDESLQLHKENVVNEKVNQRYAIDEALIENGYRNGTSRTQHGVNAEHIYVADYNIKETRLAAEQHRAPFYIEKSPEVNGPHDLIRGGELYQVKYYKTAKGSLDACIEHIDKYPKDYQNNKEAFYVIPKDQHQTIISIKNGEVPDGISARTVNAIKKSIGLFEAKKGGTIEDTLLPGAVSYKDAFVEHNQEGNSDRHLSIDNTHREIEEQITQSHQPNLSDGIQTTILTSIIGTVIALIVCWCQSRKKRISKWSMFKRVVGAFFSTGLTAAAIYTTLMFTSINAITVAAFIITLKELLIITVKHYRDKWALQDTVYSFNRGVNEIAVSSMFIGLGYYGISKLTALLIDKGYSIHFMIIIVFSILFSILIKLLVGKCFQSNNAALNRDVDNLLNEANKIIEKDSVETDYCISILMEDAIRVKEHASQIANRNYPFEKRLSAITEVNKIIFTSEPPPT